MPVVTLGSEVAAGETGPYAADLSDRLLRRFAYQAGRVAKAPLPDDVHDLRVAIRRLTQVLTALGSCFSARETKKIKRRLKGIMDLAGAVRNYDIAVELLSKSKAAPDSLLALFRSQRRSAERELTGALKRLSQRRAYSRWRAALDASDRGATSHDSTAVTAKAVLEPMLTDFLARGKQVLKHKAPAARTHRLRVAAKKLRYTMELFAPVCGPSVDEWIGKIRALQGVLGSISDCEMVRAMIEVHGGNRKIDASLRRKVRRKLGEFRALWTQEFSSPSGDGLIKQMRPPNKPAACARRHGEHNRPRAAHA